MVDNIYYEYLKYIQSVDMEGKFTNDECIMSYKEFINKYRDKTNKAGED